MNDPNEKKYKCPLCGYVFNESEIVCVRCPFNRDCNVICCPKCNYSFTTESAIVNFIKKTISRLKG